MSYWEPSPGLSSVVIEAKDGVRTPRMNEAPCLGTPTHLARPLVCQPPGAPRWLSEGHSKRSPGYRASLSLIWRIEAQAAWYPVSEIRASSRMQEPAVPSIAGSSTQGRCFRGAA